MNERESTMKPTGEAIERTAAPKSTARRMWVLLLALVVALAACSSGDDSGDSSTDGADFSAEEFDQVEAPIAGNSNGLRGADGDSSEVAADEAMEESEAEPASEPEADDGETSTAATPTGLTAADLQRDIIFTAEVHVSVDDVAAASTEAVDAIEEVGGFVFGQDSVGGAEPRTTYVFKVFPRDFDEALEALSGIGDLVNQTVSADDVTERVIDLESRISVAELGVERLRTAAEEATSLEDFAELERLLLDRETELELLRGQLRTLEDQVDLATITLTLSQDRVENNLELQVTLYEEHDNGVACPGQGNLSTDAGNDLTVCFELINTGDQTLKELTLTDTGLGIDADTALIEVFGSLDEPLAPGQSIILAFEAQPERDLRLRTRAGARPTAGESEDPAGPPVSTSRNIDLNVRASQDDPGFNDGFDSGKELLVGLWVVVTVVAGFVVPMLVLLPFLVAAWWGLRALRARRAARRPTAVVPPPPVITAPASPQPPATVESTDIGSVDEGGSEPTA